MGLQTLVTIKFAIAIRTCKFGYKKILILIISNKYKDLNSNFQI